jgi:hypothetical protein
MHYEVCVRVRWGAHAPLHTATTYWTRHRHDILDTRDHFSGAVERKRAPIFLAE